MFPGLGQDPRQMAALMKRMGIDMQELRGVEEVRVVTKDKEFVFTKPQVTVTKGQGTEAWQVGGTPKVVERAGAAKAAAAPPAVPSAGGVAAAPTAGAAPPDAAPSAPRVTLEPTEEDVRTVMQAAKCSEKAAREALQATGGDLAEAIVRLTP